MSKSKILIDRLAKLIEDGLTNSKDIRSEIRSLLKFNKENIINKLNLVTREEFDIQKERLNKIQKKFDKFKRKAKTNRARKS